MLATIHHPAATPSDALPLVIAHGLYGSGRNWGVIARRLADVRDVVAVDMRNHGDSPRDPVHAYPEMAADLAQVIDSLGGRADLLGHSMGGKAAMQLALTDGARIRRLVVADIAPVAYGHDQSHHAQAMRSLDLTGVTTRGEADKALSETIQDASLRAFFLQSLDMKAQDGPRWRLNLDVLEAEMTKIVGWPGTQGTFDGPALFLTGADSHYVKPEHRDIIRALFPAARFAKIPGTGHWLHAEKPREFEETVRVFLTA
ncbi:MAG: alpha/beta fold hydrolase [Pseudotabrizicola sp.]|uniref:alpha/beta fold hydrolase n=1 Tax=Pseudotabrizicola sp. TaxID=2939647 RepID=UPI00271E91C3|nr:alpha/beta fold hydrolase [Pseudotabrizicola sp.]MDO8882041.1 alpha/beta fold hydrolase [Pseudotabrizicola sp.]MDP2080783.1 alpha/beta fold hydrolase [Pseudotabrizicola sp.]MDZ7574631.1 alpha/beta fold hydrolase [Pseudotabrizicola sp.]